MRLTPWCNSKYALGPRLGQGGMASVHFGVVVGDLGFAKPVAIKRVHPTYGNTEQMLAHLRNEARVATRIRHPNVVPVLDVIAADEEIGIVLDYVHGEALGTLLTRAADDAFDDTHVDDQADTFPDHPDRQGAGRRAEVPIGVAVAVTIDVLHGLHAAHTATDESGAPLSVVHRDVSPQNVLVGADGIARVLDFGIAKSESRAQLTRDGEVKGKLQYMSPEQLGGDATTASDVYSAGVVLWEMLAGEHPFTDAKSQSELLSRVLQGVKSPPSARRLEVPAALDAIVMRALAAVASKRYATAEEMARALEETGLVAPRSDVSAFVKRLAAKELEDRAAIARDLERSAREMPVLPKSPSSPPPALTSSAPQPAAGASPSSPATGTVPPVSAGAPAATAKSRPLGSILLAVALLMTSVTIIAFMLMQLRGRAAAETSASSPLAPPPSVSPALTMASASALPAAPSSSTPTPTTSVAGSAKPLSGRNLQGRSRTPARPSGTTSRPGCEVPYTVDSAGFRQYRRECFE